MSSWAGQLELQLIPVRTTDRSSLCKFPSSSLVRLDSGLRETGLLANNPTAPCFYSAALYKILSELISQYGQRYSPLSARLYLIIFITFDLISIAIQGTGGGLASSEGSAIPPKSTALGTHIMLAGIIIQLVSMSIFCMLWLYFLWVRGFFPVYLQFPHFTKDKTILKSNWHSKPSPPNGFSI